ncbi:MAG: hypothetical protein K6E89_06885 [Sphaerochaetaceae bacterium]|nr:hypothetical protein [Sphaerochaetaceae bacterium]
MRKLALSLISIMLCFMLAGCATSASGPDTAGSCSEADYSSAVVSYLGPEGTYTQEACGIFFGKQGTYMPYATVHDAVEALVRRDTDYAVIPQENTIGGAVIDYVDELIAQSSVCVVGEVELPINQNLLVLPGSDLGGIRKVYSHKQGITQGKAWIAQNIPQAEVIEVSSTAEGAKMVAEAKDPSCAAIASAACADVYGLEVLAAGIQNNESNRTRFYVLSKDEPASVTSERLAFVAKGSASDLPALMAALDKAGASLVFIHDRPAKTVLGEYNYVIECSDLTYEEYLRLAGKTSFVIRYLGSFRCF